MKCNEVKVIYKPSYDPDDLPSITSSQEAAKVLRNTYDEDTISFQEQFVVMCMNKANRVMCWHVLSKGGGAGTVVDIRIVFQLALISNAHGLILSHNHPSGYLRPSKADIELTKRIKDAGKILDIAILDHIIVSPTGGYYSFADEGDL